MSAVRMHADEVDIDEDLVGRLIAGQFPQWDGRTIERVTSSGTENAIYRLGDDLAVRLPRIIGAVGQAELELRWLPRLAPLLPLPVSAPVALGEPAEGYPWTWSVYAWLDGEMATLEALDDPDDAAAALGGFVAALHAIDISDGPSPAVSGRGGPLSLRDPYVHPAIAALEGTIDMDAATAAWTAALRAPLWQGRPTWIHADLHGGNLLVNRGRLSAVIDFAGLDVGDPACDTMVAWTFLTADSRQSFRDAVGVDDATWARGRGWALSVGLIALPYYRETNPVFAAIARHAIDEALADDPS